jgi:hypothetical protein
MTRPFIRIGVWASACLIVMANISASAAEIEGDQGLDGVWWITSYTAELKPIDGGAPPLKAEARSEYQQWKRKVQADSTVDEVKSHCLPQGVPRLMGAPYPFQIVQTDDRITLLHESHHVIRTVYMNDAHPNADDLTPSFMGDSVGHWEKHVLVIDTIGFQVRTMDRVGFDLRTSLDDSGLPHSEKLHTIERLRRVGGGSLLEDLITIDDPEVFNRNWTVRMVYKRQPGMRILDYVCGEPHRDISKVKRIS